MKRIKIFLVTMASASAAFAVDIDIKPGELEGLIDRKEITGSSLVMTGSIDARDLAAMENFPSGLTDLDISKVNIEKLTLSTKKYFGKTLFAEGELPGYTFFKSGLETVVLPSSVKSIGEAAFSASSLQDIVIPEGVESIGDYAFYGCQDLKSVTLPSSLKEIGKGAFGNCHNLQIINIAGSNITELPAKTFAGCVQLESITLPSTVVKIGKEAFTHTMIKELNLNNVREFEDYALSGMPYLETLTINPEVAEKANGLLMDDISLVSLTGVPENLPAYFAANCTSMQTNDMVGSVNTIGRYALANQTGSESVVLGRGVQAIERGAISGNGLLSIDVTALGSTIPVVNENTFEGIDQKTVSLIVNDDDYDAWANAPYWQEFILKKASATVVNPIEMGTSDEIFIRINGGMLSIESGYVLTDVKIYSTDGRLLHSAVPNQTSLQIPTSDLTTGILIVKATNEQSQTKSTTVMLK